MSRRFLRAFVGAAFLGASAMPAGIIAKPPDLPENGTIIVTPQVVPADAVPPQSSESEQEDDKSTTGKPVEALPMPSEDGVTCPFLLQQVLDRHAAQVADPQIGHDVLDNLARLKEADELLELAEVLANDGCIDEAMACCERAEELCPGSPCAERAADTKLELALGIVRPSSESEEAAEPTTETPVCPCSHGPSIWREVFHAMGLPLKSEPSTTEPGREEMVCGLMRACHLFMSQGMHHRAAELARQAFALDPQRVQADPLIYKMHLLAASPLSETNEAPDPPTCPYCGNVGKPIRAIVAEPTQNKTKTTTLCVPPLPKVDYELVPALDRILTGEAKPNVGVEEASENTTTPNGEDAITKMIQEVPLDVGTNPDGSLRLSGDCSLGGNVYHLRYTHGCLAIWRTTNAGTPSTK